MYPSAIAINHKENTFFVANYSEHTIVKITPAGRKSYSLFFYFILLWLFSNSYIYVYKYISY